MLCFGVWEIKWFVLQNITMPHQWMEGNLPVYAKCAVCDKTCGSVLRWGYVRKFNECPAIESCLSDWQRCSRALSCCDCHHENASTVEPDSELLHKHTACFCNIHLNIILSGVFFHDGFKQKFCVSFFSCVCATHLCLHALVAAICWCWSKHGEK